MREIENIARSADFIVNGYSFTKCNQNVRILNLKKPCCALVLSENGEVLETSMDDIEISIVLRYFEKNRGFLGD